MNNIVDSFANMPNFVVNGVVSEGDNKIGYKVLENLNRIVMDVEVGFKNSEGEIIDTRSYSIVGKAHESQEKILKVAFKKLKMIADAVETAEKKGEGRGVDLLDDIDDREVTLYFSLEHRTIFESTGESSFFSMPYELLASDDYQRPAYFWKSEEKESIKAYADLFTLKRLEREGEQFSKFDHNNNQVDNFGNIDFDDSDEDSDEEKGNIVYANLSSNNNSNNNNNDVFVSNNDNWEIPGKILEDTGNLDMNGNLKNNS